MKLLELLELRPLAEDRFEAATLDDDGQRLFGGLVASQSLRAATLTVEAGRPPHSFHAYFLRPGRSGVPMTLEVQRPRDGRSFTSRDVIARQEGEVIFTMSASFHAPEDGIDWQLPAPSDALDPDALQWGPTPWDRWSVIEAFDVRPVHDPMASGFPALHPYWVRTRQELPDDPALHACAVAFISDAGVVPTSRPPGVPFSALDFRMGASLDHAVWFHRPLRADDWLLYSAAPVSTFGSRSLVRGTMHDRAGRHVMSMSQETVFRINPASTGVTAGR
jgi:acyl-CoA thioesterase-2